MNQMDICPKCNEPRSPNHTLVGFDNDGTPMIKCHRDAKIGPDPLLEGVNLLWTRLAAASIATSATGDKLERKTGDLKEALTRIANLELANKQQKGVITELREKQAKAEADKDKRLSETEAEIVALRGKIDEITADLVSAQARADAAESRTEGVVRLDQLKKEDVVAQAVPPPPAPAPVADAPTDRICACCNKPAVKVAKDKWELKDGSFLSPILSCERIGSHVDAFYGLLYEYRDQLVNPPDDPSELLTEFEDITPTA